MELMYRYLFTIYVALSLGSVTGFSRFVLPVQRAMPSGSSTNSITGAGALTNGHYQEGPKHAKARYIEMASRMNFDAPTKFNRADTDVIIESPSINSRRITASIVIDAPVDLVWSILTDYNNLATHVPNLIQSYLVPNNDGRTVLFQEGAQKIIGFDFRASLKMEMKEKIPDESRATKQRQIDFKLAESSMFSVFDGSWRLQYQSRVRVYDPFNKIFVFRYKTKLTYSVLVQPRGVVPVFALEWRIKEDVPVNLWAVKVASERIPQTLLPAPSTDGNDNESNDEDDGNNNDDMQPPRGGKISNSLASPTKAAGSTQGWLEDETLGSYSASKEIPLTSVSAATSSSSGSSSSSSSISSNTMVSADQNSATSLLFEEPVMAPGGVSVEASEIPAAASVVDSGRCEISSTIDTLLADATSTGTSVVISDKYSTQMIEQQEQQQSQHQQQQQEQQQSLQQEYQSFPSEVEKDILRQAIVRRAQDLAESTQEKVASRARTVKNAVKKAANIIRNKSIPPSSSSGFLLAPSMSVASAAAATVAVTLSSAVSCAAAEASHIVAKGSDAAVAAVVKLSNAVIATSMINLLQWLEQQEQQ